VREQNKESHHQFCDMTFVEQSIRPAVPNSARNLTSVDVAGVRLSVSILLHRFPHIPSLTHSQEFVVWQKCRESKPTSLPVPPLPSWTKNANQTSAAGGAPFLNGLVSDPVGVRRFAIHPLQRSTRQMLDAIFSERRVAISKSH